MIRWLCLAGLLLAGSDARAEARNVILMIGDGMGLAQRSLAYYARGREPAMNAMPVIGLMSTEAAPSDSPRVEVTDSAAAATALASGIKSYNAAIGVDLARREVPTILEAAKAAGKSTGLVVTCQVNHATPACFAAHDTSRADYDAIAVDYLTSRPDVILGGGTNYFLPVDQGGKRKDGRNLEEEFRGLGYPVIHRADELAAQRTLPLLGLFAPVGLTPVIDRELPAEGSLLEPKGPLPSSTEPTLIDETKKAIELLSKDKDGFFLMVEGSQIDWGCHANDPAYALHETLAFDDAVAAAVDFARKDGKTLVIVLADHETGGLCLGAEYSFDPVELNTVRASAGRVADAIAADSARVPELLRTFAGIESLSTEEQAAFDAAKKKEEAIAELVSARAGILWSSHDHSSILIPVSASGAEAELFAGSFDNTAVPRKIAQAMGIKFPPSR